MSSSRRPSHALGVCLVLASCTAAERDRPRRAPSLALPPSLTAPDVVSHVATSPPSPPRTPTTADSEPPPSPANLAQTQGDRHYVLAAVGDSLTDTRSHGGSYLAYLKERCPKLEVDNFAKGGTMVNQMRRRFDQEVVTSAKRYTHLLVFGGVNDLYSDLTAKRTPAKIEADLSYLYDWGETHGVKVIAFTVAPWGGFTRYFNESRSQATHALNAWIREQPALGHVDHVIDAYALLSCGDPERLCDRFWKPFRDGLHFGSEGHQLLGQALFRAAFSDCL